MLLPLLELQSNLISKSQQFTNANTKPTKMPLKSIQYENSSATRHTASALNVKWQPLTSIAGPANTTHANTTFGPSGRKRMDGWNIPGDGRTTGGVDGSGSHTA